MSEHEVWDVGAQCGASNRCAEVHPNSVHHDRVESRNVVSQPRVQTAGVTEIAALGRAYCIYVYFQTFEPQCLWWIQASDLQGVPCGRCLGSEILYPFHRPAPGRIHRTYDVRNVHFSSCDSRAHCRYTDTVIDAKLREVEGTTGSLLG